MNWVLAYLLIMVVIMIVLSDANCRARRRAFTDMVACILCALLWPVTVVFMIIKWEEL